jgi:hypothetical protein
MNNVEAKFILQGYRPNGADAADATFSAALEQAERDPQLRDWFAREQAFDRVVSAKLEVVQAPAGLREAILAGGRVTEPSERTRSFLRRPVWLAMAAGFAVLVATGVALWPTGAAAKPDLGEFALADALHSETHGGHGDLTGALQASLDRPTTRLGDRLPVNFKALSAAGCRSLTFNGHEILEVCFKRDGAWFHCYIARRADFPSVLAAVHPTVADREGGAAVAMWSDASLLYVVVSKAGRSALERLL